MGMRIAIDDRKSEKEQKWIRMRCEWLQSQYGYTPEQWAMILKNLPEDDPDWDCVWGMAVGGLT